MVTVLLVRVNTRASSIAVSPPPTTITSRSRYKKPSHVAQLSERSSGKSRKIERYLRTFEGRTCSYNIHITDLSQRKFLYRYPFFFFRLLPGTLPEFVFFFVACLILTISPLPMANLLTLLARLRLLSFHSFRGTSNDGGRCFSGIWSRQLSTESNSSNSCRIDLSNVIGGSPATPTPSLSNFKSFWSEELACSNDDIFSEIIFDRRRQASARVRLLDCNSVTSSCVKSDKSGVVVSLAVALVDLFPIVCEVTGAW